MPDSYNRKPQASLPIQLAAEDLLQIPQEVEVGETVVVPLDGHKAFHLLHGAQMLQQLHGNTLLPQKDVPAKNYTYKTLFFVFVFLKKGGIMDHQC